MPSCVFVPVIFRMIRLRTGYDMDTTVRLTFGRATRWQRLGDDRNTNGRDASGLLICGLTVRFRPGSPASALFSRGGCRPEGEARGRTSSPGRPGRTTQRPPENGYGAQVRCSAWAREPSRPTPVSNSVKV